MADDYSSMFTDIVGFCTELKGKRGTLDDMFAGMEDIYLMRESKEIKAMKQVNPAVATVIDPSTRNAIKGALRILSVNVPQVNVPFDKNNELAKGASEKVEAACNALLAINDRYASKTLHNETIFSLLMYDEAIMGAHSTKDMLAAAQETLDDAKTKQEKTTAQGILDSYKKLNAATPYLYESYNPRASYPDYHKLLGMRSLYQRVTTTVGEVIDLYGNKARRILDTKINPDMKRLDKITLGRFIDPVYICVWIEDYSEPIRLEPHGLPFINYVGGIAEGSQLFTDAADQREPFMFTEYKSEMYKRRNEIMTAWFSSVRAVGISPMWDWQHPENPSLERPSIETDGLISYWDSTGGKMVPIKDRTLIDPGLQQAYDLARKLGEESTINPAALGAFLGSATNYSLQALLSTLGKLPIEPVRNQAGRLIADLLEISLRWWKLDGGKYDLYNNRNGAMASLSADEIPDNITMDVVMDAALPQDMLQQASIFAQLDGKLSNRFLTEKIMKAGQWDEMQKEIWSEQAAKGEFINYTQNELNRKVQELLSQIGGQMGGAPGQPQLGAGEPAPEEQMQSPMEEPIGVAEGIPREQAFGGAQGPVRPMGEGGYINELP